MVRCCSGRQRKARRGKIARLENYIICYLNSVIILISCKHISILHFTFQNYFIETSMETRIIFLSHKDQLAMNSSFVQRLPWNSFARKNVGYLYAIAHGAEIIFDFDDDNILKFWIEGASPDPTLDIDMYTEHGSIGRYFVNIGLKFISHKHVLLALYHTLACSFCDIYVRLFLQMAQ